MTEPLSPEIPARVLLISYGWLVASFDLANGVVTLEEFLNKIRGKCEKIKETEVVSALIEHRLISISLLREPDGSIPSSYDELWIKTPKNGTSKLILSEGKRHIWKKCSVYMTESEHCIALRSVYCYKCCTAGQVKKCRKCFRSFHVKCNPLMLGNRDTCSICIRTLKVELSTPTGIIDQFVDSEANEIQNVLDPIQENLCSIPERILKVIGIEKSDLSFKHSCDILQENFQ